MKKKIHNDRYKYFREVLKIERKYHNISQKELSKRLGVCQSYISKTEVNERRLDIIELLEYCNAMGISLTDFVFRFEGRLLAEGVLPEKGVKAYRQWLDLYREYHKEKGTPQDAKDLDEYTSVTKIMILP